MAIKLELELAEVNGVLNTLGSLPYTQVEPLITKIRAQAIPQVNAEQAAQDAVANPAPVAEEPAKE
jgi:hypothetical protein